jgi:CHAD domain-containing protein
MPLAISYIESQIAEIRLQIYLLRQLHKHGGQSSEIKESVHILRTSARRVVSIIRHIRYLSQNQSSLDQTFNFCRKILHKTNKFRDISVFEDIIADAANPDISSLMEASAIRSAEIPVKELLDQKYFLEYGKLNKSIFTSSGSGSFKMIDNELKLILKRRQQINLPLAEAASSVYFQLAAKIISLVEDDVDLHDVDLHKVRIAYKELRYLLELLEKNEFDTQSVLSHLKSVQDNLGKWHDVKMLLIFLTKQPESDKYNIMKQYLSSQESDTRITSINRTEELNHEWFRQTYNQIFR